MAMPYLHCLDYLLTCILVKYIRACMHALCAYGRYVCTYACRYEIRLTQVVIYKIPDTPDRRPVSEHVRFHGAKAI